MISQNITQMISTVGFPIVAYLLMYKMAKDTIKENTRTLQELQNEIKGINND